MANLVYEDNSVNSSIRGLKSLNGDFNSVASRVQSLTSAMVGCRGFGLIGSGVSTTSFSGEILNCNNEINNLVNKVRQAQVTILAYSQDQDKINAFLDDLDRSEYKNLDLSSIENNIGVGRKIKNGFKSLAASLFTAGAGVVEGVCEFAETGADLVVLAKSCVSSVFTGTYDLITGSDTTKEMWEETREKVSEKKVENAFNNFYNNTEFGQNIKNNAYGFDTVRGISSGLGYTAGLIGLNVVTGGLASGLGVGAAGSVGVGQLAGTAAAMGFSSGTENAWADGASTGKGLMYGAASGAWEGIQWGVGAKINQYGGVGDKIAAGIFKGGRSGAVTRVALDAVDSGLEGFVQPGLTMIYKDYEGNTLADKYKNAFNQNGGWANVRNQAIMGGIMSAGSEFMDARKILKSNMTGAEPGEAAATRKAFGGGTTTDYRLADMAASEDIFQRQMMEDQMAMAGDFSRHSRATIDGDYIRTNNTEFNTSMTSSGVPANARKFLDGSYVPAGEGGSSLRLIEKYYDQNSFNVVLENNKKSISGYDYTQYKTASEIFQSHGRKFNINELKLIINHSEGNLDRIKSAINMSDSTIQGRELDTLARDLASKLFVSSKNSGANVEKIIGWQFMSELQGKGRDGWQSGRVIFDDLYTYDSALKKAQGLTYDTKVKRMDAIFKSHMSPELKAKIAASDGYPFTVAKLLATDKNIPTHQLKDLSEIISGKVFKETNAARVKAQYEILNGNYDNARRLVAASGGSDFEINAELFRASEVFSQKAKRFTYYNLVESMINNGASRDDALRQVKLMHGYAMDKVGTAAAKEAADNLFKSQSQFYGYNPIVFEKFQDVHLPVSGPTPFMSQYLDSQGRLNARKVYADFNDMMQRKSGVQPSGVPFFNYTKSVEAKDLFVESYYQAAKNKSSSLESLKVMLKLLELEKNGQVLTVYNNNGFTGSHRSGSTINLANQTIDAKNAATVFHETGHYLFAHVLKENVPAGFDSARLRAIEHMNSSANAEMLSAYRKNIVEVRTFSEYKGQQALLSNLKAKGFSSVEMYKKHLVDTYSLQTVTERSNTLLESTVNHGSMQRGAYHKDISGKFNFNSALDCANFDLNSTRGKINDSIARTMANKYVTTSGMVDSLTYSRDRLWYGHSREYFEGHANPNSRSYHELLADYTSFRVSNNTSAIGMLRQLFGSELMNMLENSYQSMLK